MFCTVNAIAADPLDERVERRDRRYDGNRARSMTLLVLGAAAAGQQRCHQRDERRLTDMLCTVRKTPSRDPSSSKPLSDAQRFGELFDRGAVDVFDASANLADRVMVMMFRLAEHVRRLAVRDRRAP